VTVAVGVAVRVGVTVAVAVAVRVGVTVAVAVAVAVWVGVTVDVGVGIRRRRLPARRAGKLPSEWLPILRGRRRGHHRAAAHKQGEKGGAARVQRILRSVSYQARRLAHRAAALPRPFPDTRVRRRTPRASPSAPV